MNTIFKSMAVFACILFIASCQKKDNTPADLSKVTVTFASPASKQVYHTGDTIQVNADVTYNAEITGIGIEIIDSTTDSVLFAEDHDLHTDHYTINERWVNTLAENKTLYAKVSVFVANSTDKAERMVYFAAKP